MGDDLNPAPAGADRTSTGLMERVRDRDPAAWETFASLYAPLVYRWCRRAGLQDADAADVGQEVFRSVVDSVATYRRENHLGSFRGWLRSLTRHRISDYLRRAATRPAATGGSGAAVRMRELSDRDLAPDLAAERDDRLLVLRRAIDIVLASCEPATREAFVRVVLAGEEPTAVAGAVGLSVNAVYLATSRIKKRLREEFPDVLDDCS